MYYACKNKCVTRMCCDNAEHTEITRNQLLYSCFIKAISDTLLLNQGEVFRKDGRTIQSILP